MRRFFGLNNQQQTNKNIMFMYLKLVDAIVVVNATVYIVHMWVFVFFSHFRSHVDFLTNEHNIHKKMHIARKKTPPISGMSLY